MTDPTIDDLEPADLTERIPTWPLFAVAALLVASLGMCATAISLARNIAGLTIAIAAYIGLLAHRRAAMAAVDSPDYERVRWVTIAMTVLLVGAIALIAWNSYPIALEVAER